jgi:hypothetical protein
LYSQSDDQSSGGDPIKDDTLVTIEDEKVQPVQKENFFCIDTTGLMYSFYVEGMS